MKHLAAGGRRLHTRKERVVSRPAIRVPALGGLAGLGGLGGFRGDGGSSDTGARARAARKRRALASLDGAAVRGDWTEPIESQYKLFPIEDGG